MSLVEPVDMQIGISSTASHHVLLVEQETHIHETKKPSVRRSPRAVKDGVAQSFDVLVLTFGKVLMLLMRLTLPKRNV
jgi:hypothetical protein